MNDMALFMLLDEHVFAAFRVGTLDGENHDLGLVSPLAAERSAASGGPIFH
jgi:hypothetical protein